MRPRLRHAATAAAGLALAALAAAPAMTQGTGLGAGRAAASQGLPVVLSANVVEYDGEKDVVIARDKVVVFQGDRVVTGDRLIYDRKAKKLTIEGNVTITEPGGETVFATRAELTDDLKDGLIENFRMLFPDGTKVAAPGAARAGGTKNVMAKVVFSPCKLCERDPNRAPLWQMRAREVVHDQVEQEIRYRDAVFEVFGFPIFYTPFFMHPDPSVKRKSGLLAPSYGSDSKLGFFVRTPYYYVIGPHADMTVTPMVLTRQPPAILVDYRERFRNGQIWLDGSFTVAQAINDAGNPSGRYKPRGHFFGAVKFDIDSTWRVGAEGGHVIDDFYLARYGISNQDTLHSHAYLEGFMGRDYAALRVMHFRGLRRDDDNDRQAFVGPYAVYNAFGTPDARWGRWHFNTQIVSVNRIEGAQNRRLSIDFGWRFPYTHASGWQLVATADLRADLFWVHNVERTGLPTSNGFFARVYPQVVLDWRYPWVRELGNVRQIVEPRVQLVLQPNKLNTSRISNEDSFDFEFDDSSLFAENRYPGRDRIDDGSRIVYGLSTSFFGNNGGKAEIFIGQSLRFFGDNNHFRSSGIGRDLSDVVGRVYIKPLRYFDLNYRFRIDPTSLGSRRHELSATAGVPALRVSANYLDLAEGSGGGEFTARRELTIGASSQITENWRAAGSVTYDAVSSRIQRFGITATYRDECCTITATFTHGFAVLTDQKATNRFVVTVVLKHLGEIRSGQ
jgi:LPS-assembly protein